MFACIDDRCAWEWAKLDLTRNADVITNHMLANVLHRKNTEEQSNSRAVITWLCKSRETSFSMCGLCAMLPDEKRVNEMVSFQENLENSIISL